MLGESGQTKMFVLHGVNQLVKQKTAGEPLGVYHYILERNSRHVRERRRIRDSQTAQLRIEGGLARPSPHDLHLVKQSYWEKWL